MRHPALNKLFFRELRPCGVLAKALCGQSCSAQSINFLCTLLTEPSSSMKLARGK